MSLYRHLGGAPAPLPSVAHDTKGDGWTALDTLSADDLAGLGFIPAPDQPPHDPAMQGVEWDAEGEAWVVVDLPAPPEPDWSAAARAALAAADITVLRCLEVGQAVPSEWIGYRAALRLIAGSGEGPLPDRPDYPET